MKSFDSRTYSIHDFIEWDKQRSLELNPAFQRRPVWSDKAKSFLMDTIIRGKPIPKIFMRAKINVSTKTAAREVVDGQQRLRTILSYVKDGFKISKKQNSDYGGLFFSQLPEDVQSQILAYEIAADLLTNLPDSEILDIFGRLNSYAVTLNEQERLNANHFSEFKVLADKIGYKYNSYWISQKLLSERQILRMQEINLVADLLIAMCEGIKSKKQIKVYYGRYEKHFPHDVIGLEDRFDEVIRKIFELFPEGISATELVRIHLFYSLFTAIAHCLFGLDGATAERLPLQSVSEIQAARNGLDRLGEIFETADTGTLQREERQFIQDSRRATTDEAVRERRLNFMIGLMV
ncbi:MAG: DUF262 domain-containing protein [Ancylobacter novellus]|uniref:DUF262 domain-containing protein n=1 Tax=Ancylobacter novellus TaxID=921 RepID=A0A2W5KE00_ANCNO|nr:MAG: DUF262 domain-containing protein [Ancylobacter novellus]